MRSIPFFMLTASACLAMAGCASTSGGLGGGQDFLSGGRFSAARVERIAREAQGYPLGARENPVRVYMPPGQRAYLSRLRCSDGRAPAYVRVGSFGAGVYGSIIDGYRVVCESGAPDETVIYMDMYHPDHDERAAPPGFGIAP